MAATPELDGVGAPAYLYRDTSRGIYGGLQAHLNDPRLSDIVLVRPDGRALHVHQVILASCSRKLATVLANGEATGKELPIQGVDSAALESVLGFFYRGECLLTPASVVPIYDVCLKLEVPGLSAGCEAYIQQHINPHTCPLFLEAAVQLLLETTVKACLEYARARFDDVVSTSAFQSLSSDALRLLLTHTRGSVSDIGLARALARWAVRKPECLAESEALFKELNVTTSALLQLLQSPDFVQTLQHPGGREPAGQQHPGGGGGAGGGGAGAGSATAAAGGGRSGQQAAVNGNGALGSGGSDSGLGGGILSGALHPPSHMSQQQQASYGPSQRQSASPPHSRAGAEADGAGGRGLPPLPPADRRPSGWGTALDAAGASIGMAGGGGSRYLHQRRPMQGPAELGAAAGPRSDRDGVSQTGTMEGIRGGGGSGNMTAIKVEDADGKQQQPPPRRAGPLSRMSSLQAPDAVEEALRASPPQGPLGPMASEAAGGGRLIPVPLPVLEQAGLTMHLLPSGALAASGGPLGAQQLPLQVLPAGPGPQAQLLALLPVSLLKDWELAAQQQQQQAQGQAAQKGQEHAEALQPLQRQPSQGAAGAGRAPPGLLPDGAAAMADSNGGVGAGVGGPLLKRNSNAEQLALHGAAGAAGVGADGSPGRLLSHRFASSGRNASSSSLPSGIPADVAALAAAAAAAALRSAGRGPGSSAPAHLPARGRSLPLLSPLGGAGAGALPPQQQPQQQGAALWPPPSAGSPPVPPNLAALAAMAAYQSDGNGAAAKRRRDSPDEEDDPDVGAEELGGGRAGGRGGRGGGGGGGRPGEAGAVVLASSAAGSAGGKPALMCHVDDCHVDLSSLKEYHQRFRICDFHLKAEVVLRDGAPQRFCQQCGRFHGLAEFDGLKRSCRARLQRHNARRRKRPEQRGSGGDGGSDEPRKPSRATGGPSSSVTSDLYAPLPLHLQPRHSALLSLAREAAALDPAALGAASSAAALPRELSSLSPDALQQLQQLGVHQELLLLQREQQQQLLRRLQMDAKRDAARLEPQRSLPAAVLRDAQQLLSPVSQAGPQQLQQMGQQLQQQLLLPAHTGASPVHEDGEHQQQLQQQDSGRGDQMEEDSEGAEDHHQAPFAGMRQGSGAGGGVAGAEGAGAGAAVLEEPCGSAVGRAGALEAGQALALLAQVGSEVSEERQQQQRQRQGSEAPQREHVNEKGEQQQQQDSTSAGVAGGQAPRAPDNGEGCGSGTCLGAGEQSAATGEGGAASSGETAK